MRWARQGGQLRGSFRFQASAALLLAALTGVATSGCAQYIAGSPTAANRQGVSLNKTTDAPSEQTMSGTPSPGDCMDSTKFTPMDCTLPHDIQVMTVGQLSSALPKDYPTETALTRAALPPCRDALAAYLGSKDADATRLMTWAFWPNRQGWAGGDRWLLCTVIESGPDDKPVARTGSLQGALAGDGFATFQICTAGSPSRDQRLRSVPCDQPHLGEALPDVLILGKPTGQAPTEDQMATAAQEHCSKAYGSYLGTATRTDTFAAWRMPRADGWAQGYTGVVCYAEATRPVSRPLRGIGSRPLPG